MANTIVTFDADEFRELYPQFASVSDTVLANAFAVACLTVDNTDSSRIPYDPDSGVETRKILLYLLTCHIMTLQLWAQNGQSGPVSSVSEGSVSLGFSISTDSDGTYFKKTPCGAAFWQAMLPYMLGGKYYAQRSVHPWG